VVAAASGRFIYVQCNFPGAILELAVVAELATASLACLDLLDWIYWVTHNKTAQVMN
jgi:hypothetical protein